MHTVEKPFMATQFPGGSQLAIGVKYAVIQAHLCDNKKMYGFKLSGQTEPMQFDIGQVIAFAKLYPPPNATGFLHNGILIVPLSICTKEEKKHKKEDSKMSKLKVNKIVFGLGETKNIGNFESLRVYNELEATIQDGDKVADVQEQLRNAVVKLNERDFNALIGK